MARARNDGLVEILLDLTAAAPWWVGVFLAVASFAGFSWYVAGGPPTFDPKSPLVQSLSFTAASIARWIVPAIFLAGGAVSAWRRRHRQALHAQVGGGTSRAALSQLTWREFEMLVGEYFRRRGFALAETGGGGPDGGVDLVVYKGADRYVVQCKQWRAMNVGVATVRELYGVLAASRAAGGYVVTAGRFTSEAKRFAGGKRSRWSMGTSLHGRLRSKPERLSLSSPPLRTSATCRARIAALRW